MLNLSMGIPIVKGDNKHRRIQQKVIESEIASKSLQNGFLCVGVALDSAESSHLAMKSVPIDTRTLQNGSQTIPK